MLLNPCDCGIAFSRASFTKQLALALESKIVARCSTFRCADVSLAEPEQMLWVSSINIALPGKKPEQDKGI